MMWIEDLPLDLQDRVKQLMADYPPSEGVLALLAEHWADEKGAKRRKPDQTPKDEGHEQKDTKAINNPPTGLLESHSPTTVEVISSHALNITSAINSSEIIFALPNLSFSSPTRRKYHLVFHLYIGEDSQPLPVLSVVNPTTNIPEISITNLSSAIRLCLVIPILGNSTVSSKKDTVMMCLWINDNAAINPEKNEPIICTLNLDVVKKQLVKDGKIPPNAEASISLMDTKHDAIKPINELIIDFLQRQFSLCGVKLTSFLPSASPGKNVLNMNEDNSICLSLNTDAHNEFVMVEAYKGSKEGALTFISISSSTAFLVFGFKKPVLLMDFRHIKNVSYSNITRFTFSILLTISDNDGKEESLEFGMVDQKSFQAIDEFVKRMNIDDNSFDEKHRERRSQQQIAEDSKEQQQEAASDDEDDDETYTGAVEEEEASDSEADEEYDSNADSASGSDSDNASDSEDDNHPDEDEDVAGRGSSLKEEEEDNDVIEQGKEE